MIERGEHARFPLEARQALGIAREDPREDFDRDIAAEFPAARAVHLALPPAPMRSWINPARQYNLKRDWEIGELYCVIEEETAYGNTMRVPPGQLGPK